MCHILDHVHAGPGDVAVCSIAQYMILYASTAATDIMFVVPSNWPHWKGEDANCWDDVTGDVWPRQVTLSQLLGLESGTFVSVVAAIMSFTYFFVMPTCA